MREGQTNVRLRAFKPVGGIGERHLVITVNDIELPFAQQFKAVADALAPLLSADKRLRLVFERFFLSDIYNQRDELEALLGNPQCAVSVVGQPPLNGAKIALWAVLLEDVDVTDRGSGLFEVSHGAYRHLLCAGNTAHGQETKSQTRELLLDYCERLSDISCTLASNCVRTWFFVRDIDVNYHGVVTARNEVFNTQGLTSETHFIASTGIGGLPGGRSSLVQMDAYSISGLIPAQIRYLSAPTHLNRTCEYGVSFERGTVLSYGDRRHVLISGTASIDNKGRVLYTGDIRRQTERMLENVNALLKEAECGFGDVMHIIVYLRDMADYNVVERMMGDRFPDMPLVIVQAPVCRPEWLIEMECIAIAGQTDNRFPAL